MVEDTYTLEEALEMLESSQSVVRGEVESELINTASGGARRGARGEMPPPNCFCPPPHFATPPLKNVLVTESD